MNKRGSYRDAWHPTLRALGVAAMQRGGRLDVQLQEHTRVMRLARSRSVSYKVVGGSETAEAPNWYDYALRDRRELLVHDGALRVGVFDASVSRMDTPVVRGGSVTSTLRSEGRKAAPSAYQ